MRQNSKEHATKNEGFRVSNYSGQKAEEQKVTLKKAD